MSNMIERKFLVNKYVGRKFKSRKTYPFTQKLHRPTDAERELEPTDIKYGDDLVVDSYDEETGLYKVTNLSLKPHYVNLTEEELIKINAQWR